MIDRSKYWLLGLVICLLVAACEAPQPIPSATPVTVTTDSTSTPIPSATPVTVTTESTSTPVPSATPVTVTTDSTSTPVPVQTVTPSLANRVVCPESIVGQMVGLNSAPLPAHLQGEEASKTGQEFDVNQYLTVLTHLSMQPGYVLDYAYYFESMGGEPILYARPVTEPGYRTYEEFYEATGLTISSNSRLDYLQHVQIDGTREGFVEFVVLRVLGGQFYLFWHAGYNDVRIVCDRAQIEAFVSNLPDCTEDTPWRCMTQEHKQKALALNLEPAVDFEPDRVVVGLVTFSKWSGYSWRSYAIRREFPHEILEETSTDLVPYDCGLEF